MITLEELTAELEETWAHRKQLQEDLVIEILDAKEIPLDRVCRDDWKVNPKTRMLSFKYFAEDPDGKKIFDPSREEFRKVRRSVRIPRRFNLSIFQGL